MRCVCGVVSQMPAKLWCAVCDTCGYVFLCAVVLCCCRPVAACVCVL